MLERLPRSVWVLLVMLASLPAKLIAAQQLPFDIDIVPVVARNVEYVLTPVGTLSSVAAYNMPMLEWLHLPAQWLTGDVWWTIILTLLVFNLLSMLAVYSLACGLFGFRAGLVALTLFAFSEVGISSAYTAWAQLLLPGFFAMTAYCLWRWRTRENGLWLALAGIVATAAFMTHFAAVLLYPAMLAFALVTGARWQWRGLALGTVIVALMLTPYMLFQLDRDFVDVRAFLTQEVLVDSDVMAQVEVYKPGYTPPNPMPDEARPQLRRDRDVTPRWQRALVYAAQTPVMTVNAFNAAFSPRLRGLDAAFPALSSLWMLIGRVVQVAFWLTLMLAIGEALRGLRREGFPSVTALQSALIETRTGRVWLLTGLMLVMIAVLIVTRTISNTTYLMGFVTLQLTIAAALTTYLPSMRRVTLLIIAVLIVIAGGRSADRILRVVQHDDAQFSPLNAGLYRHMEAATDFIAANWSQDEAPVIQYDFIEETPYFWWVPAWHTIDDSYRLGMSYDFLLAYHHGIVNANRDPIGFADDPDFIVLYTPALARYDLANYEFNTFGVVVVLQTSASE